MQMAAANQEHPPRHDMRSVHTSAESEHSHLGQGLAAAISVLDRHLSKRLPEQEQKGLERGRADDRM